MGFLKRHYEKILLAVLLSVFIGLLAFQLVLWQQNEQIRVEKMKGFKEPAPNYVAVKFDDPKSPYRVLESMPEKPVWNEARSRSGQSLFTDLMIPYPMALCPYCSRVIPANCFPSGDGAGKCPFEDCGKILHAPYNSAQEKEQDSDGDGIADKEEVRLGLNPQDSSDAAFDNDDDGFSNYEEFLCKTDLKNSMNRPPYHEKLFVRSIVRAKLPFRLKNVSFVGSREKTNAEIQLELEQRTRTQRRSAVKTQDRFVKLNSSFQSLAGKFKVVDVLPKFTKNASGLELNESRIVVQKMSEDETAPEGEKITLEIGKVTYEPRVKAILGINLVNEDKEFEVFVNSKFKIGKLKTGEDAYTVVNIDQQKNTVTVKFERDGKDYVIENRSMLEKKIDQIRKAQRPRRHRRTQTK